ncbi:MAG: translation initiation factor IF-3 [Zetaproteobacteria bacterium CG2_30_46_52]|nr:MAG: translation initiation factor IF-3 [Zetaproteobacteria bacterium CG2_30_46_52]
MAKKDLAINHEIDAAEVRVVGHDGELIGVLGRLDAIARAEAVGLDLIMMSPNAKPPVCKIMDYGKYKYDQAKKANEAKKKQHVIQVKEVKVRASTDQHDLEVKLRSIRKFLEEGNKVKVSLRFRGREMAYTGKGAEQLQHIAKEVEELGKPEKMPNMEGRQMIMIINPLKK